MAGRRDPWVRWFDVTSPKKHSGGFTIYKVTSKVFPVHSPEATTEIVVWKRYKDINRLHKTLYVLHRNLHRPSTFPEFPKPRIFGRFDDEIIEERRLAAIELLNFIGSQAHLFNSLAVQEFFETSESTEGEKPDQNILQPVSVAPVTESEELNNTDTGEREEPSENTTQSENQEPNASNEGLGDDPAAVREGLGDDPAAVREGLGDEAASTREELGDEITLKREELGSAREEEEKHCEGVVEEDLNQPGTASTEHIDVPVTLQIDTASNDGTPTGLSGNGGLVESLSGVWAHRHSENTDSEHSDNDGAETSFADLTTNKIKPSFQIGESVLGTRSDIMDEFDPCRENSSPRQAGGVSNAELLSEYVDNSVDSLTAEDSVDGLPSQGDSSLTRPADTLGEYIQSNEDYLYKAVKQIRRALREEKAAHYQTAFDYYKRAVAVLLTGVQGDGDEGRRSVVKRKTAEYLLYAEQLHNRYLDSSGTDGDRWRQLQVPRNVARLRDGLSELANYKVLGLIGGNMLVSDKRSDETYVIKVLQKNAEVTDTAWAKQIIPTKCTHMIKLTRYFETESTIYLLLEYAQGGTLWQYVYNYLHGRGEEADGLDLQLTDGADNIYSGKKYKTTEDEMSEPVSSPESQVPQSTPDVSEGEGEVKVEDTCSRSYLDMLLGNDQQIAEDMTANNEPESSTRNSEEETCPRVDTDASGGAADPVIAADAVTAADHVTAADQTADDLAGAEVLTRSDEVFKDETAAVEDSTGTSKLTSEQTSTRRMSLRRSNSAMSRSVSVERASDSINSARHRNWSAAFDDLNVSGNRRQVRPHLPESCVQRWAAELLVAVNELHRAGLLLRDLKPANILLNSRGHVILTYFCRWPGVHQETPTKSVERLHVSPEGTFPGALCLASDYWSFGVILYELLAGISLASAHPEGITSHTILRTPDHLSQEAEHLLKQLLRYNWRERLGGGAAGVDEIKAHPFFSNIEWTTL